MSEYKSIILEGESLYLRPWENQKGTRYGPPDRDEFEVTLVNVTAESLKLGIESGRNPTQAQPGSSKMNAGFKEYYKLTSQFKIDIADSQANPIADNTFIPNGSKIRVYVQVRAIDPAWQKGNTHKFYATAVQLIKLVKMPEDPNFVANSGVQFDKVENGYVATATEAKGFDEVKPEFDPILDDEIPF